VLYFENRLKVTCSVARPDSMNWVRYVFAGELATLSSKLLVQCTSNKQQNPAGKFPDLSGALHFFEVNSKFGFIFIVCLFLWRHAGRPRGRCPSRGKIFLLSTSSRPVLGPTQPPIQCVLWVLSLRVKQLGCETDHWLPAGAQVKNTWNYTLVPYMSSWRSA
jgi:hypothetical protein